MTSRKQTEADDRLAILNRGRKGRAVRRVDAHLDSAAPVEIGKVPDPYDPRNEGQLDDTERDDLAACESAVGSLQVAFASAGKALATINRARLYRETHSSFDAYVEERWGMKRSQAYRLIEAWPVAAALSPIGDTPESHVRELVPVAKTHGLEAATAVYADLRGRGGRITAAIVRQAVRSQFSPEPQGVASDTGQKQPTTATGSPVDQLKMALKAQRAVWSALAPSVVQAAMQQDPEATRQYLADVEIQATRTAKRARRA
ncbi:hypothetical protein GCM10027160_52070 [Streptomyces calidiresistens]|uniref:Uncharacterized protein n=1 Tax=Streptomyces calidiresistens TaxID=1485586 RepID=A0A7W3T7N0_9ACTN|nr:hypothetical protein [Streptomyces calidiresistens]MBB0232181.1 hypothetical protein [Streptomyces calidiresistens]